jgi:hypothetical protein
MGLTSVVITFALTLVAIWFAVMLVFGLISYLSTR